MVRGSCMPLNCQVAAPCNAQRGHTSRSDRILAHNNITIHVYVTIYTTVLTRIVTFWLLRLILLLLTYLLNDADADDISAPAAYVNQSIISHDRTSLTQQRQQNTFTARGAT